MQLLGDGPFAFAREISYLVRAYALVHAGRHRYRARRKGAKKTLEAVAVGTGNSAFRLSDLVNISLTNKSDQPFRLNMLYFQLEDSNGVRRPAQYTSQAPDPIPNVGSIAPGGELRGNLAAEVPQASLT